MCIWEDDLQTTPGLQGLDMKMASSVGVGEAPSANLFFVSACRTEWEGQSFKYVSSIGICTQEDPGSVGFPSTDSIFDCGLCLLLSFLGRFVILGLFPLLLPFHMFSVLINMLCAVEKKNSNNCSYIRSLSPPSLPSRALDVKYGTFSARQMLCHRAVYPSQFFLETQISSDHCA